MAKNNFTRTEQIQGVRNTLSKLNKKLTCHHCSICNYPCGYVFINDKPYYDSGCNCLKDWSQSLEPRTEEELSRFLDKYLDKIINSLKQTLN